MAHANECDRDETFFSENESRQETLFNRPLEIDHQGNIFQPLAQHRPQQNFQLSSPVEKQRSEIPLRGGASPKSSSLSSSCMIKSNKVLISNTSEGEREVIIATTQKQTQQKKISVERKKNSLTQISDTSSKFPCRKSSTTQLSSPSRERSPKAISWSTSENLRTMHNFHSSSDKENHTEAAHSSESQHLDVDKSKSERALNVLYPKTINNLNSLAQHVHRLEEAYLSLLRVQKKEPLHLLPKYDECNGVHGKWSWEDGTIISADTPAMVQNGRRGACGHTSYVTLREVTLLRASLEATKCVAQEWISDDSKENKGMTEQLTLPQDKKKSKTSQVSSGIIQQKRKASLPHILLQSSSLSPDCAPRSRKKVQQIEASLQTVEAMATEMENVVGDSMLAQMTDPAFDIELPALNDANYSTTGSAAKAGLSQIKMYWRKWREGKKEAKKRRSKAEKERSEKIVQNEKCSPVVVPPFPSQKKAHSYGSHISTDYSPRRTLGVSPSTPSCAPWPSYWRTFVDTPWERLMQVLIVGFFNFFVGCPLFFIFTVLLVLFSTWKLRLFILLYFIYIFSPLGKPKFPVRSKKWYKSLSSWKFFRDYFPVRQIIPPEVQKQFDPLKNYLFCYHPHAIHAFGAIATFGGESNGLSSYLPGLQFHLQTLSINFFIPFWREMCMLAGLGDASSACIRATLRSGPGKCVALVIGGAEESILARPRTNDLVLKKRKGFVKMALETGSSLVPVYGFGETNNYESLSCVNHPTYHSWQQKIKRYTKLTLPGIAGRGPFGVWPLRRPIFVVFGAPIDVPKIPSPTETDIEFYHQKYVAKLLALYDEYCGVYDVGCQKIRILQ